MDNIIIATFLAIVASVAIMSKSSEGYWNISGSNMKHAYLPQSYKNNLPIRNFTPHGATQLSDSRQLETFNYNPRPVRNNVNEVENAFKSIEQFQQRNNISRNKQYNNHTPQQLPKHNLSETFIPKRPDYQLSGGVGISSVTPNGYRNGARPDAGVNLLRKGIFENYSTIQLGLKRNLP